MRCETGDTKEQPMCDMRKDAVANVRLSDRVRLRGNSYLPLVDVSSVTQRSASSSFCIEL
jgi:hypothetical protein